jgi:hypothetical protein
MNIYTLKADAVNVMAALNECWSDAAAINYAAAALVRIHGIDRETAIVAAEQARWSGWP